MQPGRPLLAMCPMRRASPHMHACAPAHHSSAHCINPTTCPSALAQMAHAARPRPCASSNQPPPPPTQTHSPQHTILVFSGTVASGKAAALNLHVRLLGDPRPFFSGAAVTPAHYNGGSKPDTSPFGAVHFESISHPYLVRPCGLRRAACSVRLTDLPCGTRLLLTPHAPPNCSAPPATLTLPAARPPSPLHPFRRTAWATQSWAPSPTPTLPPSSPWSGWASIPPSWASWR